MAVAITIVLMSETVAQIVQILMTDSRSCSHHVSSPPVLNSTRHLAGGRASIDDTTPHPLKKIISRVIRYPQTNYYFYRVYSVFRSVFYLLYRKNISHVIRAPLYKILFLAGIQSIFINILPYTLKIIFPVL